MDHIVPCLVLCMVLTFIQSAQISAPQAFLKSFPTYQKICQEMHNAEKQGPCKAETIAFHATIRKKEKIKDLNKNKPVIFDTVDLNKGGAYNATTGTFTAPQDGVYSFDWTILSCGKGLAHAHATTAIVIDSKVRAYNGKVRAYNHCYLGKYDFNLPCSHAAIIEMKVGDQAWISTVRGGTCVNGVWTSFSGFLL